MMYLLLKVLIHFFRHTLLDKSLRALQLPTHMSNLTENGK